MTNKITRNELEADRIVMERWFDYVEIYGPRGNIKYFAARDQYKEEMVSHERELVTEPMTRDDAVAYAERACRLMNALIGDEIFYTHDETCLNEVHIVAGRAKVLRESILIKQVGYAPEQKPAPQLPKHGATIIFKDVISNQMKIGAFTGQVIYEGRISVITSQATYSPADWLDAATGAHTPNFPLNEVPSDFRQICSEACKAKLGW